MKFILNADGIVKIRKNPESGNGWPDQFIERTSTQDERRKKYGLSVENTVAKVKAQFSEASAASKLVEVA